MNKRMSIEKAVKKLKKHQEEILVCDAVEQDEDLNLAIELSIKYLELQASMMSLAEEMIKKGE